MNKKILIIFWGHPLFDGRCINMMNQLIQQGHLINVMGVGKKTECITYKNIDIELIGEHNFKNSLTKYFKYFEYVKNYIKNKKADVIIASDLYSMIPCAQTKIKHNAKIIYDSRELYTQLGGLTNKPYIQKIWSWYEKKYINKIEQVLVTADIDKDYLKNLYQHPNIKIIKNLPGDCFLNKNSINLKEALCLNQNEKILLYQGKFHKGRGIRFTIQCMHDIPNTALVLIGDGPMKNQYIKEAKKYNMEDKLFFIDAVPYEKLATFSEHAFIGLSVIQPISKSYENALPNKLFEYAVSGLPVICSDLKAMKEMVGQYNNGIVIPYNDKQAFKKAYQKINTHYNNYVLDMKVRENLLWRNNVDDLINE